MSALAVCHWLYQTALGTAVREGYYAYAVPQVTHLLSMGVFGGAVLMDDLRLLGWLRQPSVTELMDQLRPLKWIGFALALVSGAVLFTSDAVLYYTNSTFLLKMGLLLAIGVNAWIFRALVYRDAAQWSDSPAPPAPAKAAALISLLLWISVIAASRTIAFTLNFD